MFRVKDHMPPLMFQTLPIEMFSNLFSIFSSARVLYKLLFISFNGNYWPVEKKSPNLLKVISQKINFLIQYNL